MVFVPPSPSVSETSLIETVTLTCWKKLTPLELKFASPLYSAVTKCELPKLNEVVSCATPLGFKLMGAPAFALSILNCTVPVGVPEAELTVAVKVTLCPTSDGLTDDVMPVLDALFTMND
jgi:hypothetical protein